MKKLVLLLVFGLLFYGLAGCGGAAKKIEAGRISQSDVLPADLAAIKQLLDQGQHKKAGKKAKIPKQITVTIA